MALAPDPDDAGTISNFDDLSDGFTQNTGNVNVNLSVLGTCAGARSEFYSADQLTDGIVDDGAAVDGNSAKSGNDLAGSTGPDAEGSGTGDSGTGGSGPSPEEILGLMTMVPDDDMDELV